MTNIPKQQTNILNTLVEINNDRIEGYKTAIGLLPISDTKDVRSAFEVYKDQSIQFNNELKPLIYREEQLPVEGTTVSGKVFRIWMDIKALISPSSTLSILNSCERGEQEHQKVYKQAIENKQFLQLNTFLIIESQSILQVEALRHITALIKEFEVQQNI